MIEQAMFYALGFASAGLLALAALPAVWKRAVRLTDRRLRQLVPLSTEEIAAERDQLRAGFAVEQRRLEQQLDRAEAARAGLLETIGRGEARSDGLETALRQASERGDSLATELRAARREIQEFESFSGTAAIVLNDLTGLAESRFFEVEAAQGRIRELESGIDEGRATAASLHTRVLGLESRLGDLNQALAVAKAELARTVDAVGRVQAERDALRRAERQAQADADGLRRDLDEVRTTQAAKPVDTPTGGAPVRAEPSPEVAALQVELAAAREAQARAAETIAALRQDLAARGPSSGGADRPATEADLALVRAEVRQFAEQLLRADPAAP